MKKIGIVLIALCFAAAFYLHYFSDKKVIERTLRNAARAAEEEKLLTVVTVIAKKYHDPYGNDFETAAGYIKALFDLCDEIEISLDIRAFAIDGDKASIPISFSISGIHEGQRGMILGESGQPAQAILEMEKIRGNWQIVSTSELQIPGVELEGPEH